MVHSQRHRGPDDEGFYFDRPAQVALGHNRLSIIDLSAAGHQPMSSDDGRFWIVFNGEIYNYRELRKELSDYPYRSQTDSEVVLAAFDRWGESCLDRFVGMFAFLIWDTKTRRLFGARDRFGVKPIYYAHQSDGTLLVGSEIKALHRAGVPAEPEESTWARYLASGAYDCGDVTFWKHVKALPAGCFLRWRSGDFHTGRWYSLSDRVGTEFDSRPEEEVGEDYTSLLRESLRLRFRSDVPVGVNLSGGLDSSVLLGLIDRVHSDTSQVKAFTFTTGDPDYDELPWVKRMLSRTKHPSVVCELQAQDVPKLAESVQFFADGPFGGLPTLAYARLFESARDAGSIVLLDGQGMDEQWAGYDYYTNRSNNHFVQGSKDSAVRPHCLTAEFKKLAEPTDFMKPFPDHLRNLQYRDISYTKIPRALRFNDRISMRSSTELREPFLDHRLVELSMRQKPGLKIRNKTSKWLLRRIADNLMPSSVSNAPKRPLQTPQREWLRGPLRTWAGECIEQALASKGGCWLDSGLVRQACQRYNAGQGDNSFFIWQWISLGLMSRGGGNGE